MILYLLDFSDLYPTLSPSLIFFFLVVFVFMGIIGFWVKRKKIISFSTVQKNRNVIWLSIIVILVVLFEGVLSGGFPLLNMLLGRDSGYADFGIPTLHVIIMTFNAFLATYVFHILICNFSLTYVFVFLLNLIPNILVVNRGMLVMIFMNCLWIFLLFIGNKIRFWHIASLVPIALIGLFAFGIMGNARLNTSYQNNRTSMDTSQFLEIGKASDKFKESAIPEPFFWGYVYATSPLANLQKNIDRNNTEDFSGVREVNGFVFSELIPDFIGKRIISSKNYVTADPVQVTPELNAVSAFTGAFQWLGWPGMLLYIIYITIFAFIYIYLMKLISKQFFVVGVSTLCSVFLFSFFANMFSFTGLIFQLIYPIVFSIYNSYMTEKNESVK